MCTYLFCRKVIFKFHLSLLLWLLYFFRAGNYSIWSRQIWHNTLLPLIRFFLCRPTYPCTNKLLFISTIPTVCARNAISYAPAADSVGKPNAPKLWQLQRPPVISWRSRRVAILISERNSARTSSSRNCRTFVFGPCFFFRPARRGVNVSSFQTLNWRAQHPKIERFRRASTAANSYRARPFPLPRRNNNNNNNNNSNNSRSDNW
jgi:hypothetical protein